MTKFPAITSVSKIVSNTSVPVCQQTLYAPAYLNDPEPKIPGAYEVMLTQGDTIFAPSFPKYDPDYPLSDPNKGVDRIRLWIRRPAQKWEPYNIEKWPHQRTNVVIGNHMTFPWMQLEGYLLSFPEDFIGATAGPTLYKDSSGNYHCWFSATAGDLYLTTKRQFVLYHAISKNLIDWRLVYHGNKSEFLAFRYSALWYGELIPAKDYDSAQGISSATVLLDTDYVYLVIGNWRFGVQKNGLIRYSDSVGFEIWKSDSEGWEVIINGQLPAWFTKGAWDIGNPFPHIISHITLAPNWLTNKKYMLVSVPDGTFIEVAFSDDLIHWEGIEVVESKLKGFADGTGYKYQIKDPRWTGESFLVSTNDLGVLDDIGPYGTMGCLSDPYHGCVIAEIKLKGD